MKVRVLDKKKVVWKNNLNNTPRPRVVNKILKKIPDNPKYPLIFMKRKQYITEYANNQEKIKNIKYRKREKDLYYKQEMPEYRYINSKYTTKKNPYYKPAYIVFNDKKISDKELEKNLYHEYGHEEWEKNDKLKKSWKQIDASSSPTDYGKTDKEEDFAESFMLYKLGKLEDNKRKDIIEQDIESKKLYDEELQEFITQPCDEKNRGRCGEAAKRIVNLAIRDKVPMEQIKVFGFTRNHPFKEKTSNHVVAKIGDKYFDPTRTQFGEYDTYEYDKIPFPVTNMRELNLRSFIDKDNSSDKQNLPSSDDSPSKKEIKKRDNLGVISKGYTTFYQGEKYE